MAHLKIGDSAVFAGLESATFCGNGYTISVAESHAVHAVRGMIEEIERLRAENAALKARPPVEVTVTPEALDRLAIGYPASRSAEVSELFGILERCVEAVGGGSRIDSIGAARTVPGCIAKQFGAMRTARDDERGARLKAETALGDLRYFLHRIGEALAEAKKV